MSAAASDNLVTIRQRLSPERMAPYEAASADLAGALKLYEWNINASAAFHGLLHGVEVLLRNAINDQMVLWHDARALPGIWFDDPARILEPRLRSHITNARNRVIDKGRQVTIGRLVSELTFGFWRYLLTSRYEQALWTPALRHAFPNLGGQHRQTLAARVERLNHLRNRIAHYEPIYPRRLDLDQRDALAVIAAICGDSRAWLAGISPIREILARQP